MTDSIYRASKTRSQDRPGWTVTFRHPRRKDKDGKWGLKVRRGLGTGIDEEADELIGQLNELLSNRWWWSADKRVKAEERFPKVITSAFYNDIEVGKINSIELREESIPLPTREDGYARIMLVGTTGAGKTTLLRHIIGSDHTHDRFPATSTGRTTTADIEIITLNEGPYKAAVTFISKHGARSNVEECLAEACISSIKGEDDSQVAGKLLSDPEQRFRMSYLIGNWQDEDMQSDDDFLFDDDDMDDLISETEVVAREEEEQNISRLREYVLRVKEVTNIVGAEISEAHGTLSSQKSPADRDGWLELFEESLSGERQFRELVDDIIMDIRSRIDAVDIGEFELDPTGWPMMWTHSEESRDDFLKTVRLFTSNHWRQFGKLLTPLVDGLRVQWKLKQNKGDLYTGKKLVLIDGQGLGHTARSVSSISTHVSNRFSEVDMILLVDNATQPMQAAPLALLHSVGIKGYTHKLALAFTHFDLVKGPNLRSFNQKLEHVIGSVRNATTSLRNEGSAVANALDAQIGNRAFFLGGLNKNIDKIPGGVISQLRDLMNEMQESSKQIEDIDATPIYSSIRLELAIRDAVDGFKSPWRGRLGIEYQDSMPKEHWARIKALSRRFAEMGEIEYNHLRPVADLATRLQESISRWLNTPTSWRIALDNEDEERIAIDKIRRDVNSRLEEYVELMLYNHEIDAWQEAYWHSGTGSTFVRAREINAIHERVAPTISSTDNDEARQFMESVREIVRSAVRDNGGEFRE